MTRKLQRMQVKIMEAFFSTDITRTRSSCYQKITINPIAKLFRKKNFSEYIKLF